MIKQRNSELTIKEATELFILSKVTKGLAESTVLNYRDSIDVFCNEMQVYPNDSVSVLTNMLVNKFIVRLKGKQMKNVNSLRLIND